MSGCLYSVGVGPGDPELMTLKAVKIIRNCQVLVLPAESKEKCVAYQIVRRGWKLLRKAVSVRAYGTA